MNYSIPKEVKMSEKSAYKLNRRDFLKAVGVGGATLLSTSSLGWSAKDKKRISVISEESDPNTVGIYDKIIKNFEAKHPDVEIVREYIGFDDLYPKLQASIMAGDLPQLMRLDSEVWDLTIEGMLSPVTDTLKEIAPLEDYLPGMRFIWEGEDYAIPTAADISAIWYRKDLFEKEGLKEPRSWDDLLEAAKILHKPSEKKYGIAIPLSRNRYLSEIFLSFYLGAGGKVFPRKPYEQIGPQDILFGKNEAATKTMEFIKELCKYAPPRCQ